MPNFSKRSLNRLINAHPDLIRLFKEVIKERDCDIRCSIRGENAQNIAYRTGASKLKFPDSLHNKTPSLAVDVYPWINRSPTDKPEICRDFGIYVLSVAAKLGIKLRWGGDWDMDGDQTDQSFNDLVHFELVGKS